ncbi:MAG: hypothetical protein RXO22_08965 [Thermocladium sp.]
MDPLQLLLNPPTGLGMGEIAMISFLLGMMHGATPDEHTWPITFSYAIGKYSTKGGMKAGLLFSLGFTIQRAFLTTLGYMGLAYIYQKYNLDGPVYVIVGIVMAIAGSYILRGRYIHLPIDELLGGKAHHTREASRLPLHEIHERDVPLKMTIIHGLIAGFGFGAYATIITFVLAPQVPGIIYAPIPGLLFGLGTMVMQMMFGAVFGSILRTKHLGEEDVKLIGKMAAGRTLYYGGLVFTLAGLLIIAFPTIDAWAVSTGIPIPNLDAVNIGLLLVVTVVGAIGIYGIIKSYMDVKKMEQPRPSNELSSNS